MVEAEWMYCILRLGFSEILLLLMKMGFVFNYFNIWQ